MKTGLVLEGGGLRGIFTAGVLDVLMEEGIKFDGAVGVSAGAAFGSNYKSEQNRRAIRYNLRFAKDPRYSSIMSLIATGNLFNAQFCYHDIPEKLDPFDWETFRKNPMEFYLVCTDVETGKAVYHLCDNDDEQEMLEWFRASGSMPLVSRIVEIGDRKLLDGGIADSIPLRFMEEQGYERNLVVLTRPANYVKTGNPLMAMIERGLRNYPEGVEAIRNRHIVYNEELAYVRQREIGKYAFVIRPDHDLDIGRVEHDRTKIRAAYKAGRRKARKLLPEIMTFLEGAKADFSSLNASMVEGDVSVSDVVKPSLVEDPAMVSGTAAAEAEGFGKSYEEHPEEISGRENKDIPEELFGKVKRDDTCDGADEEKFEGAPAPAAPSAAAGTAAAEAVDTEPAAAGMAETEPVDEEAADAATADTEPADAKPTGVTSASLVESFGGEPAETAPGQDEDQKVRVQEVRAVLLPEEEEELPAFQRPFPMDREPDQAASGQAEDEIIEAGDDTSAAEIEEEQAEAATGPEAEEPTAEEAVEEAEAAEVEESAAEETAEETETVEAEEPEVEESAVEESAAEETAEETEAVEAEEPEVEEPAAEETAEETEASEVEEPAEEEPAAEETAEETEAVEAEEPAVEESAGEETAEETETVEVEEPAEEEPAVEEAEAAEVEEPTVEEPAAEEPAAEEPIEETRFVMPTEEESEEETIGEEFAAEEPATEEPIADTEEPADASAAETSDDSEASVADAPAAEAADDSEASAEDAAAAETADDGEASAEDAAAAETADDSEAFVEAEPVKEASGPNPFRYRNKGRKQKKVWKPGNMTALKEKAKDQNK